MKRMKKLVKITAAVLSILSIAALAQASSITTYVNGASGPWDISLNPTFGYGDGGNVNLPPTTVSSASGLSLTSGDLLTIANTTPGVANLLAGNGGSLWSDANGVTWWAPCGAGSPAVYIPGTVYLEELIGVFAHNGVIVDTPFAIGNGPTNKYIPPGANQLLLGVSDGWYNDNGGGTYVNITETVVPLPPSVLLLGFGMVRLLALGRRKKNPTT
jgi:hypothetical protein